MSVLWWYLIVGMSLIAGMIEVLVVKSRQQPNGFAPEFRDKAGELNVVALKQVIKR